VNRFAPASLAALLAVGFLVTPLGETTSAQASTDEPFEYVRFDPAMTLPEGDPFPIPPEFSEPAPEYGLDTPDLTLKSGWTWSVATHKAGSANTVYGTSGGGVWQYDGMYYIPGIGHVDKHLGASMVERVTGTGALGAVSHSDNSSSSNVDVGLIATGTKPLLPQMRVSNGWTNAKVTDVAHDQIVAGTTVCHSGTSTWTRDRSGYRCGKLTTTCNSSGIACTFTNLDGLGAQGDSGGPVWWYHDGGVKLLGWMRAAFPGMANGGYQTMTFVPVWALQKKDWKPSETWGGTQYVAPFPSGKHTTGCFVTTIGCIRS
jgi:hypothetical protein